MSNKTIVIVGATSGIAEQCARRWAKQFSSKADTLHLLLIARNVAKLKTIASDLQIRNPQLHADCHKLDFTDPEAIQRLAGKIVSSATPDIVLIAHGDLPDQSQCQQNLPDCARALIINGSSAALFAEAFATPMEKAGHGTIAVISSVAGDRGRKSNYVYGAAKGLVNRYMQGLQHRFAVNGSKVRAVLIKPGPTDTAMTAHLKQHGARLATAGQVADSIIRGIDRGKPVIYAPGRWAFIMMIVRHLPRVIFNKMDI